MTESLLTKLQREARENIDYVDEFQAAAIEEAIANTLKQAAEEIEGIKLGGEGKPIFVGANASQRMEVHNQALTDAQRLLGEDNES